MAETRRVLIVEDDADIAELVASNATSRNALKYTGPGGSPR